MTFVVILLSVIVGVLCDEKDGGKAYRIPLNDGNSIPALGLGTFLGFDEDAGQNIVDEHVVTWALKAGYRMIDAAAAYQLTEGEVGAGVRASGIPRENVFIVTKLPAYESRDVLSSLRNSLARLNMTYVDLYLIHSTVTFKPDESDYDIIDYLDTWKAMEEAKKLGLAKSIGISNFNVSMIERLLANCEVKPSVLQVEVNLNLAQNKLLDYCKSKDIVVMAYTPLGSLFSQESASPAPRVDDPTLVELAKKYGKSVPQIVLRYLVQRGVVPIPKSVSKNRVEENIEVFDFELTKEEMETLKNMLTRSRARQLHKTTHPTSSGSSLSSASPLPEPAADVSPETPAAAVASSSSDEYFSPPTTPPPVCRRGRGRPPASLGLRGPRASDRVPAPGGSVQRMRWTQTVNENVNPDESDYDIIDYLDTWKAMEEAKKLGLAKSIGISNFNVSMIERLLANCEVKPSVLQVEVNLNLAQNKLLDYCKSKDIVVMAYTPLGSLFSQESASPAPRVDDPTLVELAKKYGKSVPQIVLRYLVQRGVVPIPKSVSKNRVEENIEVFDFELTKEEMETLSKFNKDYRIVFPSLWQDHPYYPYEKVDVPVSVPRTN